MRNHNGDTSIPQEFYLWPNVTAAAKNALDIRYRLLDYLYTGFYKQNQTGAPVLSPLFYKYPNDSNTFGIELQFFYGNHLLVSPVTKENATSVEIYLPEDLFYDFGTYFPVQGNGSIMNVEDVGFHQIPVHIKAGAIIPMRTKSAMTTKALRQKPFHILIAPDADGKAQGELYLDDGDSIEQNAISLIEFSWADNVLSVSGKFDYKASASVESITVARVTVLGVESALANRMATLEKGGNAMNISNENFLYNSQSQSVEIRFREIVELNGEFTLSMQSIR
jgi:alpha-glucosidase